MKCLNAVYVKGSFTDKNTNKSVDYCYVLLGLQEDLSKYSDRCVVFGSPVNYIKVSQKVWNSLVDSKYAFVNSEDLLALEGKDIQVLYSNPKDSSPSLILIK